MPEKEKRKISIKRKNPQKKTVIVKKRDGGKVIKKKDGTEHRVVFFETAGDFRVWLEENHDKSKGITVGYYNVRSKRKSMTYPESVDQALCFGWIDSVRHKLDDESYSNRFTPRKNVRNWSDVNIKKMERLIAEGLMTKEKDSVQEENLNL